MYNNKRKKESQKRRDELYTQKTAARNFIYDYEYKDQIIKEEVNLVTTEEIADHLKTSFEGYLVGAVPKVERAEVLEIPNIYHLELFPNCNEASESDVHI